MVHTGKPSRGCVVCRKRRIKCDEVEPHCGYCRKKHLPCPGYKSQFDLAWRDQNQVAEKSVQRRKNVNDGLKGLVKSNHYEHQLQHPAPIIISVVLSQDYASYALDFFFSYYICLPRDPDVQRGFLDSLYPIWLSSTPSSCLRPIVTAVASVMLGAWSQSRLDRCHALYTQGLAGLRQALQSGEEASDEIIMAGLMLQMYENLTSFLTARRGSGTHMTGATAMIASRHKLPIEGETSQRLVLGARAQVIGRALAVGQPVPLDVGRWAGSTGCVAMNPGFRLDGLNVEVANLQALASQLSVTNYLYRELVVSALERANELDRRLAGWTEDLPVDWTPVRVSGQACIPESVQAAGLYQVHCDVYKSIFIADNFNAYYSSRIKLQLTILTCLNLLTPSSDCEPSRMVLAQIIQDAADSICATIPFHLGDRTSFTRIDDMSVRYPTIPKQPLPDNHITSAGAFAGFYLGAHLPGLLAAEVPLRFGQKQWIMGQLGRVQRIYSIQSTKL